MDQLQSGQPTAATALGVAVALTVAIVVCSLMTLRFNLVQLPVRRAMKSTSDKQKNAPSQYLTIRISNLPHSISRADFEGILDDPLFTGGNQNSNADIPKPIVSSSYAPASFSQTCMATVTLRCPRDMRDIELLIKRKFGHKADRVRVDSDFLGLTPLFDPGESAVVDIIAVTGLAGHAFGSWKAKGGSDMWLRDFLPEAVPRARILTYGYDTRLPGSQSEASVYEMARRLLESAKAVRCEELNTRPLIFIGHSLGGIIVKQALVEASEGSEDDRTLFLSCCGLLLFGVPNRGLRNEELMTMVKGQPNQSLVHDLGPASRFLSNLHRRFSGVFNLAGSQIVSIFETQQTPTVKWSTETGSWQRIGTPVMMVPHSSAIEAGSSEKAHDRLSIDADHSGIVKFSGPSDPDYIVVAARIQAMVNAAQATVRERFVSQKRKLSHLETEFIKMLKAPNYAAFREHRIEEPAPGTLGWFPEQPNFRSWQASPDSATLWITGAPGQGKTILAKFLISHLEASTVDKLRNPVVYFFFYDQDETLRDVHNAMRAIMKQLLAIKGAFQSFSEHFEIDSASISDDSLWSIFEQLFSTPSFDMIYCVIDALDECSNNDLRDRLLRLVQKWTHRRSTQKKLPAIKLLLFSRPTVSLHRELNRVTSIHLKAHPSDLEIFIRSRVNNLALDTNLQSAVVRLLRSKVEQTFLWISIILKRLKTVTILSSEADLERIINESPSDLTALYKDIIDIVMHPDNIAEQKLLTWVVYGRRPMSLGELEQALAVQRDSKDLESTLRYRTHLTEHVVVTAAGVFLEVNDNMVHLIHQSAKDFLRQSGHLAKSEFCAALHPSLYLADVCMVFLCFKEFEEGPCCDREKLKRRLARLPFAQYAARHWHRHISTPEDGRLVAHLARRLTQSESPLLLAWAEAADIADLEKAKTAWDIATSADIPWLVDLQPEANVIDKAMVLSAHKKGVTGWALLQDMLKRDSQITESGVRALFRHFDRYTVQIAFERQGWSLTPSLLRAALGNCDYGDHIIHLLFRDQDNLVLSPSAARVLSRNHRKIRQILNFFLSHVGVSFPDRSLNYLLQAPLSAMGVDTLRAMLDSRGGVDITFPVVRAVFRHSNHHTNDNDYGIARDRGRNQIMIELIDRRRHLSISPEVILHMLSQCSIEVVKHLLQKMQEGITITDETVRMVEQNIDHDIIMIALLDQGIEKIEISNPGIHKLLTSYGVMTIAKLLNSTDEFVLTQEALELAIRNDTETSSEVIKLVLDSNTEIAVTDQILALAATYKQERNFTALFNRNTAVPITDALVKAAASNRFTTKPIKLIIERYKHHEIRLFITDDILMVAAQYGLTATLQYLLRARGDKNVSEALLCAAASRRDSDSIDYLLNERQLNAKMTVQVIWAAVKNSLRPNTSIPKYGVLFYLVRNFPDATKVLLTVETVVVAIRNLSLSPDLLNSVVGLFQCLTDEIVLAALKRFTSYVRVDYRSESDDPDSNILDDRRTVLTGDSSEDYGSRLSSRIDADRSSSGFNGMSRWLGHNDNHILETPRYRQVTDAAWICSLLPEIQTIRIGSEAIKMVAATGDVRALTQLGQYVTVEDGWMEICRLRQAAVKGEASIVEELLRAGTPADTRDIKGTSPIVAAAEHGHREVVRILARRDDVNICDVDYIARAEGWFDIMLLVHLVVTKSRITDQDANGSIASEYEDVGEAWHRGELAFQGWSLDLTRQRRRSTGSDWWRKSWDSKRIEQSFSI